jgi:hypothetical protein
MRHQNTLESLAHVVKKVPPIRHLDYVWRGFRGRFSVQTGSIRTIHLVIDNLNTRGCKSLVQRYGEKLGGLLWNRFPVHYPPKQGSWLRQAKIEVSLLSGQCLGQRRIGDLPALRGEVHAWERRLSAANAGVCEVQVLLAGARRGFRIEHGHVSGLSASHEMRWARL